MQTNSSVLNFNYEIYTSHLHRPWRYHLKPYSYLRMRTSHPVLYLRVLDYTYLAARRRLALYFSEIIEWITNFDAQHFKVSELCSELLELEQFIAIEKLYYTTNATSMVSPSPAHTSTAAIFGLILR